MPYPVEVVDAHLVPVAVADPRLNFDRDPADFRAEGEREAQLTFDDLQRHEVVLLVVAAIVQQDGVTLSRRKPEKCVVRHIMLHFPK